MVRSLQPFILRVAYLYLSHRYFSPYPLTETEIDEHGSASAPGPPGPHTGSSISAGRIPGVSRSTLRSHGRTSDLLAGGLGRSHGAGEKSVLWVCDRCFKYMAEGHSWELHVVRKSGHGWCMLGRHTDAPMRRGSAPAGTHQDAKCINVARTLYGRLMGRKRRSVRSLVELLPVADQRIVSYLCLRRRLCIFRPKAHFNLKYPTRDHDAQCCSM